MAQPSAIRTPGFRFLLVTQFLGAFNDNAFKLVIMLLAVSMMGVNKDSVAYVALAAGLFTLPFIIFSSPAGFLADRHSKKTIMVWAKVVEIVVMVLGGIALYLGSMSLMIFALFLMGAQSTFFSPAKYGILPEIMSEEDLSRANGLLQMWTFTAIILGTGAGGMIKMAFEGRVYMSAVVFTAIAVTGTVTSFFITPVPAAGSRKEFEINILKDVFQTWREMRQSRPLFLCALGSVYFWFIGALFQMNILIHAKRLMGLDDQFASYLLTSIALGVGIGSVLAGRWSRGRIEFGLVPMGAIGLGVFSVCSGFAFRSYWGTATLFALLGMCSALFNIPLSAYIQQKSPKDSKGRVIATTNFFTFSSMVFAAIVFWLLLDVAKLDTATVFIVSGLASFGVIYYICKTLPDFLLRFMMWLFTTTVYRMKIVGKENLPKEGGALLVCNHVSYMDGFLVQAAIQRAVRFVLYREYYEAKWLNPFCRIMKAIPISANDGPKQLVRSLREASDALKNGDVVCIFAEGAITRTGNMLSFGKGIEFIMRGVDVPIIPMNLDRVWGSIFSFESGKFFAKLPYRVPYPVTLSMGNPMPARSTSFQVRQAVSELWADAVKLREHEQELLSTRFFLQARRTPFSFCMTDSTGVRLSYNQAMIRAMALSRAIRRETADEEMVGVMLPSSVAAALVNVAVTILGKVPVNLNFTASEDAVDRAIDKCGIRHIFTSRAFIEKANIKARDGMVFLEDFRAQVSGVDKALSAVGFFTLPHFILARIFRWDRSRTVNDVATVIFSSGSTGDPKGVMLSHANINANIEGLYQVFHLTRKDCVLGILPLFHSFGFTGTLWQPLTSGMSVAYHNNPLDFKTIGQLAQDHQATILTATPTFLMGFIRRVAPEQFASLRHVVVGAEKLKERVAEAFEKRFGIEPLEGYGCTELSPVVAGNMPNVKHGENYQIGRKPGTIGQPLPGVAVKVVDADSFEELSPDEDGLLLVKGPNVMLGYLGDPEKTAEVMHGDWYITGDIASVDADGFITIKDRLSRFSKIGGEMVPHIRIEEEIHRLLKKATEQVCAVTSLPDERKGESLAVLHVSGIDIEDLCRQLAGSDLPKLWIPRRDAFFEVEEIPVLGTGKLDLKQIKTVAQERAGAGAHADDRKE